MSQLKSIGTMIEELNETTELTNKIEGNDWALSFIADIYGQYITRNRDTTNFSDKQVACIEQLYHRYVTSIHPKVKFQLHSGKK